MYKIFHVVKGGMTTLCVSTMGILVPRKCYFDA